MLAKDELLDRVVDRVREQMPDDRAAPAEEFARQYFAWIPREDLDGRSPIDLYGAAMSHFGFAYQRSRGEAKVRVYNPQFEEHGWQSTHTALEVVTDDMPFLVDSTRMEVNTRGYSIHLMLHPIMKVKRDNGGRLLEILPADADDEDAVSESVIHVEVDRQTEPEVLEELGACIERVLSQVRAAVEDWPAMLERVGEVIAAFEKDPPPLDGDDLAEAQAFLRWISDNNFTFLGYREYDLRAENGEDALMSVETTGLGILREDGRKPRSRSFAKLPPEVRRLARRPNILNLTKANSRSSVHRPSYMDYIGVKKLDDEGNVTGERRFLGLYTFSAYSMSVFEMPIVRRKVRYVMERSGFPRGSHNEKDLVEILETYPRDELFQIGKEELFDIAMGILHLQERQRVRLFVRRDTYGRFFSCLVYVPRDRYDTEVRRRMQEILQDTLGGVSSAFDVRLSESVLARLHFIVYVDPLGIPEYDVEDIEERLAETTRSWADNLYDALIEGVGEELGNELFRKYRDTYGRFFSCLVYVPRDRYDTEVRRRMQEILQNSLGGVSSAFDVRLSESVLARLHFIVYVDPAGIPEHDVRDIEERLAETTRSWADNLYDALIEGVGEELGNELFRKYRDAFPAGYRAGFLARTAVTDIRRIEDLASEDDLGMSLYHPIEEPEEFLGFKLFRSAEQISLSTVLPLLEDMGVEVVDERPHKVEPAGSPPVWIYDFGLVDESRGEFQTGEVREIFQDAFARAYRGLVENDGFNRLVLRARLTWRQVTILRAYCKYLRQAGTTFSQTYMEDTLFANPHVARLLVDLFECRFDPKGGDRAQETERLKGEIEEALDEVVSLDEDRILRNFLDVTLATVRTNYYQTDDGEPKAHLSFKFDPREIPLLPLPRPRFEIFVYSPSAEGVHLRGGEVARGGIRWSDRREDFRTEVLGLMKAQMVKNAVIVPVGAKGGFVVKRPPLEGGRDALQNEVVACYRTLICGMLDLTDNLVEGDVVPPPSVTRYDDDDPYLVVAADKGTATFSDIANGISAEYGFWLGDAFASGGSVGYDHKEMGITARGAWESVKRHFRELGRNVQEEDFTVVGIGDMSGDVFGNGMLLSPHTKLVAAFNHLHIFIDPDPDPEASFAERERLFRMARSTWADYDAGLISEGGGVFPRTAKSVPLSQQIKELLGTETDSLTPNELIHGLLKAEVDLLWNGGIGTYVKASTEGNAEVGDRTNDSLRVDGRDLRCRVVGEGGNLGFTQAGRIEYALRGGRIYMDAVDNSAGVDCSDHEVNIKILLDAIVAAGDLTEKQRNELLASMTDEVGGLVLGDNYDQTLAISNALALAHPMVDVHARYIRHLEQSGALNRELEVLPSDETLAERRSEGGGLTAPEFAILLSYTKIKLYRHLLDSDLPEDPYLSAELARYFPTPLRERFGDRMEGHRLRREIVATRVANGLVNRAGPSFVFRLGEETGAGPADISRAFTAAAEVFDLRETWEAIESLDNEVGAKVQTDMLLKWRRLVERSTRWLLRNRRPPLDISATVSYFREEAPNLASSIHRFMIDGEKRAVDESAARLIEKGVPEELAHRVSTFGAMFSALDVVDVAVAAGERPETAAEVYFALGDRLRVHWLRHHVEALPRDNRWRALARAALRDDVYGLQAAMTAAVLRDTPAEKLVPERIEAWTSSNGGAVDRTLHVLSDINASGAFDLATLSVALREVRNLVPSSPAVRSG